VFGFGNWSYNVSKLESVSQETNQNQNQVICYKAVVQITVHNEVHSLSVEREDVGFGTGIAKTQADAHENGAKESITDGLKRCLRSFGNQFGNSLYDKSRNKNTTNTNVPIQNQTFNNNVQQQPDSNQQSNNQQLKGQSQYDPCEYQSLYNLGLEVNERNGFLLVSGNDIFSKKDSIKACGFRWDGKTKQWYKQLEQGAA
jgi:DNA repair and recombination protein RAD52